MTEARFTDLTAGLAPGERRMVHIPASAFFTHETESTRAMRGSHPVSVFRPAASQSVCDELAAEVRADKVRADKDKLRSERDAALGALAELRSNAQEKARRVGGLASKIGPNVARFAAGMKLAGRVAAAAPKAAGDRPGRFTELELRIGRGMAAHASSMKLRS